MKLFAPLSLQMTATCPPALVVTTAVALDPATVSPPVG
jgi:hypothetical protein